MGALPFRLSKGDLIALDGASYEFADKNALSVTLRPISSLNALISLTHDEMKARYFNTDGTGRKLTIVRQALPHMPETLEKNLQRDFLTFSAADQEAALLRLDYMNLARNYFDRNKCSITPRGFQRISRVGAWLRRKQLAARMRKPAKAFGLECYSGETLKLWYRRWRSGGYSLNALLPENSSKGPAQSDRLSTEVAQIVERAIRSYYLTAEAPSLSSTIEVIQGSVLQFNDENRQNHQIPSQMTIWRWVKRNISDYEITYYREGKQVAEQKFRNVKKAPRATRPLERVQIDHTLVDILLVREYRMVNNKRIPTLARPWLTLARCEATGMTVGFHLSFEKPSWSSVMACLRMCVLPKDALLDGLACKSEWPIYGIPEMVILDNAKEFHSNSLRAAAGHLGFEVRWAPRGKGHLKGKVERANGEVARNFLAFLPGKTFANVKERGKYPSEKLATLTLPELINLFIIWTVDYVHNRGHSRIMMQTPLQRLEELKGFGVRLPPDQDQLKALIGLTIQRKIQSEGVEYLGLWYKSPILRDLKRRPAHKGKNWTVKADPSDLSSLMVLDDHKGLWESIPSDDPELTRGLTLAEWRQVVLRATEQNQATVHITRRILLETRLRLQQAGTQNGAGKKTRLHQTDIDWANQYQSQVGPFVNGREKTNESGVPSDLADLEPKFPENVLDATRRKNRKQVLSSVGKVSEGVGYALDGERRTVGQAPAIEPSGSDLENRAENAQVEPMVSFSRKRPPQLQSDETTLRPSHTPNYREKQMLDIAPEAEHPHNIESEQEADQFGSDGTTASQHSKPEASKIRGKAIDFNDPENWGVSND